MIKIKSKRNKTTTTTTTTPPEMFHLCVRLICQFEFLFFLLK
jgi:hypothetical protein